MLRSNGGTFQERSEDMSLSFEARRLQFEHNRLLHRLTALHERSGAQLDSNALRNLVIHIARHLHSIRTDSLKLFEFEIAVMFDLSSQQIDRISRILFAGAVAELIRRISTREASNAMRGD